MNYQLEKQHTKNKCHSIERIKMLFDKDSFCEIGSGMSDYAHALNNNDNDSIPYDGVITGRGKVKGKNVFVFSQDFSVKGGTLGRRHGYKISRTIELAMAAKAPVVGIYDSGGARIGEGINALAGCGSMLQSNILASGLIPQYAVVVGPSAGASAYSPALSDFVFMVDNISYMFVTGSEVVKSVTGQSCTNQELGGAEVHSEISGVAHKRFSNEKDCFKTLRNLIEILPSSCFDVLTEKLRYTPNISFNSFKLPQNSHKPYDMKALIASIVDDSSFFEIEGDFAKSMVTGFARLSDVTIGVVANQPLKMGGAICCDSSDKAARFIRFCDCFNIPIITLVDTPGYLPGLEQEHKGIIRHGAKLLYAYTEATVLKITIIIRKAYGGAYIAMGSKHLGTDYVYALENAEIAVMGAEGAVPIFYKKEIAQIQDPLLKQDFVKSKTQEYKNIFMNVNTAVREGFVDEVLNLSEIRKRIFEDIMALKAKLLYSKDRKKHGNLPL